MKEVLKYLTPLIICFLLIIHVFISNITTTTYKLNHKLKSSLVTLLPERWYFFTSSAKQNSLDCYKILKSGTSEKVDYHNSSISNIGGINRHVRCVSTEISLITKYIPDSLWNSYRSDKIICLDSVKTFFIDKALIKYLDFRFEYLFESRVKKSWMWSNDESITVNKKLVKIKML